MNRMMTIIGALAVAATATASGEDFPLTFRTIPAKDVMSFPGGSGTYGQVGLAKPEKLRKEPKPISRHPLYGVCSSASGPAFLFRLDESKGDRKGYDRLIVDMNQNGDLSDDPVVQRAELSTDRRVVSPVQMLFGPIQAPADKALADGRPVYFAQVYIFNSEILGSSQPNQNIMAGQLMLKAGWYLDTTVTVDGLKRKVGLFDGDSNLRLGDVSRAQMFTNREEKSWYFQGGDSFLVGADASGKAVNDLLQSETCAFGPILYLGAKACQVALAPDCKSLRVEPWSQALAEVTLKPRGDQVRNVTLAWEQPSGRWQLIRPTVAEGKIMVPPGNYRLYASSLVGKSTARDQVMVSGMQRVPQTPVSIVAGKANALDCGAPLDVKVTAAKVSASDANQFVLGGNTGNARDDSEYLLRISANVAGVGGEIYSTFQKGEGLRSQPPKPTFTIAQGGKTIASGNLEFGWGGTCSYSWRVPKNLAGKSVTVNVEFDLKPLPTASKPVEVQLWEAGAMDQPPIIQAEPVTVSKFGLGRIGLLISLAPVAALATMLLCRPGWGSPIATLGGLTVIVAAPLGFILSLLGVILNKDRRAGIVGLIIIGALAAYIVLPRLWLCAAESTFL